MRIIGKNISFTFLQSFLFCGLVFWHFSIVSEEYPESIESIEPMQPMQPMQPIESDKQSANYPANYPPPEPSFLCIDTPFNMETGEFDPANPALCPTGDRHVNKTLPAGFQNKEGSLVDGKGKGRGTGSSDDDGYGGETQSPGGESLSDWVERQRQEREFNDNMYRQLEQDYRNYQRYLYEKHLRERYLFDVITQVIKTVKYSVGAPFIDELHQEFFTSDAEINQEWLNKINIKAKQIYPQVYQIMMDKYKEVGDLIEGISLADIIQDATTVIKYQVATKVVDFKIKYLTKQKMRELGRLFVAQGSGTKIHQTSWIEQANTIINQVEDILNTDLYKKLHLDDKEYVAKDIKILEHAKEIEEILHNAAYKLAVKHVFNPTQNKLDKDVKVLSKNIQHSTDSTERIDLEPLLKSQAHELYEENIMGAVKNKLKTKYSRGELAFLEDKSLTTSLNSDDEKPYSFQSPKGEFLDKVQGLYNKLYEVHPYHQQGMDARAIGLAAVEVADQEFVAGKKQEAEIAYHVGETMSDIALGVMPYIGVGKDIYEALTGKHLLTGRRLTHFERSFSVIGIALSGISGGVLSSGVIKTSINQSSKVLNKIINKVLYTKTTFIQSHFAKVIDKAHSVLSVLQDIGFKTKRGVRSTTHFLKRAFVRENPSIREVRGTLHYIKKAGIEDYTKALEELDASSMRLPFVGKEFLARQMRFSKMLKGRAFNKKELVDLGNTYSVLYKNIDSAKLVKLNQNLWRAVGRRGYTPTGMPYRNMQEDLFRFKYSTKHVNNRYSMPGERAMYTSLTRKTAIKEIREKYIQSGKQLTNQQIKYWYHIGSKNIELDQVLDLTDANTLKNLSKNLDSPLTQKTIAKKEKTYKEAYKFTHIIGHIAKRKGIRGIKAPSAYGGNNVVIFRGLNK